MVSADHIEYKAIIADLYSLYMVIIWLVLLPDLQKEQINLEGGMRGAQCTMQKDKLIF